jgi:hypothetical protein
VAYINLCNNLLLHVPVCSFGDVLMLEYDISLHCGGNSEIPVNLIGSK